MGIISFKEFRILFEGLYKGLPKSDIPPTPISNAKTDETGIYTGNTI